VSTAFPSCGALLATFVAALPTGLGALATAPPCAAQIEPDQGGELDLSSRDPQVALASFTLPAGYSIELVASEREFPELANPVALRFDGAGRLFVACMPSYPMVDPGDRADDYVLVLEDLDGDGSCDRAHKYVDGLVLPTGIELGHGGLYVVSQPDLWFVRDTDGDLVADRREVQLTSFSTTDTHHALSALTWTPSGGLLLAEGVFHTSQIETPHGVVRNRDAGIFLWEPARRRLTVHVDYPFANPWGQVFDRYGRYYIADASGGDNLFGTQLTGRVRWPGSHPTIAPFTTRVRPTAGAELIASRQFPDEVQGDFLVANCIGFRGIKQHRVIPDGAGVRSEERPDLLSSSDPNFRPVDLQFGPDGCLYLVDWFNPLIGHMQYSLFDGRRDRSHGRIWRIAYDGLPRLAPPRVEGRPTAELLELLRAPEDRTRYRVRRELWSRPRAEVGPAASAFAPGLGNGPEEERLALEALWVQTGVQAVDGELLGRCLAAQDARVRAAAVKVLRSALPEPADRLERLAGAARDGDPAVRLEALAALSEFDDPRAVEAALGAAELPLVDPVLVYVFEQALEALEPVSLDALTAGRGLAASDGGLARLYARLSPEQLRSVPAGAAVDQALLAHPGVPLAERRDALGRLAAAGDVDASAAVAQLFAAVADSAGAAALEGLEPLLLAAPSDELQRQEPLLAELARHPVPEVRRLAWRARLASGAPAEELLQRALASPRGLRDLARALEARGARDPHFGALLAAQWAQFESTSTSPAALARRLRLTLPGAGRILNLSEVEVFAGGDNVARRGHARSSSVDWSGPPEVGIDGVISGVFGGGGLLVHTRPEDSPWFEIEFERDCAVELIRVHNRTEVPHDQRLAGFRLELFADDGQRLWLAEDLPAPGAVGAYEVELGSADWPLAELVGALGTVDPERLSPAQLLEWQRAEDAALSAAAERALGAVPVGQLAPAELETLAERLGAALEQATFAQRLTADFGRRIALARRLTQALPRRFPQLERTLLAEQDRPSLERLEAGRALYTEFCSLCHQPDGRGLRGAYPPLAGSSWVAGDPRRPILIALHGLSGPIEVDGVEYEGAMAPLGPLLDDRELADLLTYVRQAFGGTDDALSAELVADQRARFPSKRTPFSAAELARALEQQ
jgi:mono/diheme cytochrome c family protein/glucose/arabinose dehydrogenase